MRKSLAGTVLLFGALLTGALSVFADPARPDAISTDGGRYYGPMVDGKFQGKGRLEWDNGDVYEGEFADGRYSGKGRAKYAGLGDYDGEFRDGRAHGKGRFRLLSGDVYTGEFREGLYSGKGRMDYNNGSWYEGDFERGELHGKGHFFEKKGSEYKGGFDNGRYSGEGESTLADGARYRGSFANGYWNGKGRFENAAREVYEGDFKDGEFTGKGTFKRADGTRFEGEFLNWRPAGQGKSIQSDGSYYEGRFTEAGLTGRSRFVGSDGTVYDGLFKDWRYDGQGELKLPNGDVYKGSFRSGFYHGKGTLTYARARGGKTQETGMWQMGRLDAGGGREAKPAVDVETAIYAQRKLLDDALAGIAANDPSKVEMYVLAVAGDGAQEVFRREVEFVRKQFADKFGTGARTVSLVNSRSTLGTMPMATVTSVGEAVKAIAAKMDKERDILFIYLTSHGSPELGLYLNQNSIQLRSLTPRALAAILKESGIRWKMVVVSACYAGGFLSPLRDETTMVIAAARSDRKSFGCADENDFTYFGEAYFRDALPRSTSFAEAFEKARAIVEKREAEQQPRGQKPKQEEFSRPQMHNPEKVDAYLRTWWGQAAR
jgi:hypothetical protein